jgi:RNA polymerase sigma factor (sigma-70 family)
MPPWNSDGVPADLPSTGEWYSLQGPEDLRVQVEKLYEDTYAGLFRYLIHSRVRHADADEFIQEAFLRFYRAIKSGGRIDKPRNWLLRVLHHIRVDETRRGLRNLDFDVVDRNVLDDHVEPSATPEAQLLESERLQILTKAMKQLTDRQYQYLLLRTEGLKLKEIAELFDVTAQSVAETCARAMTRIEALLNE